MERGYIKLFRAVMDNFIWKKKPFSYGQAWAHIIMTANHKEGTVWVQGTPIKVSRGQLGRSKDTLSREFGWTRQQMRTFMKHLISNQMINHTSTGKLSIITILNYDKFHGDNQADSPLPTTCQPNDNHVPTTNKKDKNIKKEKKEDISPLIMEIIDDLNKVCGKRFSHTTDETVKFINGRLSEGKTLDDFKRVHRIQAHEWKGDAKFDQYLRPNTLYRPGKFESYMNKKTPEEIEQARKNSARIRQLKGKLEDAMEDIEKLTASLLGMPEDHENYKPYHARIGKARGFIERTEAEIKRLEG